MELTINLDRVCFAFPFTVTMVVKNVKKNKIWRSHSVEVLANNIDLAEDLAKAKLKKDLRFISFVSIRRTGGLCFAFYHDIKDCPPVPDNLRKLIPAPEDRVY